MNQVKPAPTAHAIVASARRSAAINHVNAAKPASTARVTAARATAAKLQASLVAKNAHAKPVFVRLMLHAAASVGIPHACPNVSLDVEDVAQLPAAMANVTLVKAVLRAARIAAPVRPSVVMANAKPERIVPPAPETVACARLSAVMANVNRRRLVEPAPRIVACVHVAMADVKQRWAKLARLAKKTAALARKCAVPTPRQAVKAANAKLASVSYSRAAALLVGLRFAWDFAPPFAAANVRKNTPAFPSINS